jgi:hypothetical protein
MVWSCTNLLFYIPADSAVPYQSESSLEDESTSYACSMPVTPEFLLYIVIDNRVRAGYMASRVAGSSGLKPV